MTEAQITAQVEHALTFPWTVLITEEDGEYVARVAEMPDAIATGATHAELEADLWASLRASLRARLTFGDPIPRPARMARGPLFEPAKILRFTPISSPSVQTSGSAPLTYV